MKPHTQQLRMTCAAALATSLVALSASACQSGIAPLAGGLDTLSVNVAADAHPQDFGVAVAKKSPTDQALKLGLADALIFDPWLPPSEISLAVQDGHVKLTGSVGTLFDSIRAADVVRRFSGVSSVDNQLEERQRSTAICMFGAR